MIISRRKKNDSLIILPIVLIGILAIVSIGLATTFNNVITGVSHASSWIVTGQSNIYNGYLSGSTQIPFFTETSFQTLMQTDILASSSCIFGCSISMLPGSFNQSDTINVTRPGISISGTPASIIYPNNTQFHSTARSVFNILPSPPTFVAQRYKVDDYTRAN